MRLLLVEDELAIRSAVARSLGRWGHAVAVAGSVEEACSCARQDPPEGLVSDLKLPDGSGLDLASQLAVPFVMMSGFAGFDEAIQAMRLGCVDFLTKPVAMQTLKSAVTRMADRHGAWDLCIIADGKDEGMRLVRSSPTGFSIQGFSAQELRWSDRQQAKDRFHAVAPAWAQDGRQRRILAELVQASADGRVVVNRGPTWWRAWLDARVDWAGDQEARDRRALLARLADRGLFREDGTVVECSHV